MTFAVGEHVQIVSREHEGHHRTPAYVKGRSGTVVRHHGAYPNPETGAYGADGLPALDVYLVALDTDGNDRVLVDVYANWLEAAA